MIGMNYTVSIRNKRPHHFATRRAANDCARAYRSVGHDVYVIDNTDPAGGTDWSGRASRTKATASYCEICGDYVPFTVHGRGDHR
jgi:hypothetical protein